ncbi:hypothetical protein EDB80DRAFT_749421 [Ilyonectria destructans]|nr:hypothetical protein EDB80DRAFT_749421 [Ilyonectria destructans]
MADGTYAITGLPRPADAVNKTKKIPYVTNLPVRYEISAFAGSKDKEVRKQWTLYVLALERFKTKPVDEKLSYFQVAGIHGYPETVWDNAPPPKPDPSGNQPPGAQPFGGYCNHNGINFPNWHRPYMLLFEQCIWNNMKDVIQHWKTKHGLPDSEAQVWYAAAEKWRLPYWDWARKQTYTQDFAYPEVLTQGTATGVSRYGIFVNNEKTAFRGLDGINNPWTANSYLSSVNLLQSNDLTVRMKHNPGNLADSVNRMFSPEYNSTWGQFASTKWRKEGHTNTTGYMSLEYIHNNVHNLTGGSAFKTGVGHMSDVPVAAFDPIFWLHHCQIDRLLAIWQSLYWDLWFDQEEPPANPGAEYPNVEDDKPTDFLQPFHNKTDGNPEKDVWTAELCRNWTDLNYHYDDLMKLSENALASDGTLDEQKFISDLQVYINATYPSTAHLVSAIREAPKVETPEGLTPDDADEKSKSWKDYIINVLYDRYALNGRSYTIEFYLGGPENQPKTHYEPQNLVGRVYTFGGGVRSSEAGCGNCKKQSDAGVMSCGQVPLTIELLHHALDHSGGAVLDASRFPNTEISVLRGVGRPRQVKKTAAAEGGVRFSAMESLSLDANAAAPTLPPVYSDYKVLPQITQGKPGAAPIPS